MDMDATTLPILNLPLLVDLGVLFFPTNIIIIHDRFFQVSPASFEQEFSELKN